MGPTLTLFVLLLVAAALFYGGRWLTRTREGREKLGDVVGRYPQAVGLLLLVAIAALIVLGVIGLWSA
jgi:hypothetical protein